MVEMFKNLVYSIAKKYSYNKDDLEDLYQVGVIGLSYALSNYKKECGAKFSTYAHFYIKGEILKYLRENRPIKINYEIDKLNRAIIKVKEYLTQKYSKEPTIYDIASYLDVSVNEIETALNSYMSVKSLDYNTQDSLNESNLYDYEAYIEKGYDDDLLSIKAEIEKLSDEEKRIIVSRYYEDKSQLEVSKDLGISQVQVSRKEGKILSKIRNNLVKEVA